jgi:hypothetical protein
MKKFLCLLLFVQSLFLFSQQLEKVLPLNFKNTNDLFQVVEEDKKQVLLFFRDKNRVLTVKFNDKFEVLDSISSTRPPKNYDDIVGYSISDNRYYSYWSTSNNKEITTQCFDFTSKKVSLKTFNIDFEKEKPVKTITVNSIFYLITVVKSSSILNFYVFDDGNLTKKTVDLSEHRFLSFDTKTCTLWSLLNSGTGFEGALSVQNISNDTPPSLTFSANKRKVYANGNELFFTFDNNKNFTQTITINLNDFSASTKGYNQPYLQSVNYVEDESNSFYVNGKLIQMKLNENRLAISVKDIAGNELKTYEILKDKEVTFKNSDIIQENGSINRTRILDKSNQLLRKIYYEYPSMSCYYFNDIVYLTIGSVSLEKNGNGAMYGAMFGLAGVLIATAITSNYSLANLNSYKNRKVVYINCLFDKDFNHIDGEVNKLAFDKLRALSEDKDDLISQSVFKFNSKLYFGGYDKQEKSYKFFSFTD